LVEQVIVYSSENDKDLLMQFVIRVPLKSTRMKLILAACDWLPLSYLLLSSTPRRMCFMQQEIASVETMAVL